MNNNVSFDAMLQMAARESTYRQLDNFPSKKELEKMYSPSSAHKNKIDKLIRKENRSEKFVQFNRYFTKVAVILLITFTVTLTPLITAKAVRESIVQTVIEWKDEFASIFFKSEREPAVINEVKIGYLPEGFEATENTFQDKYMYTSTYKNHGHNICVSIFSKNTLSSSFVDNEYSNYYPILIDGNEGILICSERFSALILSDNKFIYRIDGSIDIRELINIYKQLEIF